MHPRRVKVSSRTALFSTHHVDLPYGRVDDLTGRKATILEDGVPGLSLGDKASSTRPLEVRRFERSIETVLWNGIGDGVEVALLDCRRAAGSSCVRAGTSKEGQAGEDLQRQHGLQPPARWSRLASPLHVPSGQGPRGTLLQIPEAAVREGDRHDAY